MSRWRLSPDKKLGMLMKSCHRSQRLKAATFFECWRAPEATNRRRPECWVSIGPRYNARLSDTIWSRLSLMAPRPARPRAKALGSQRRADVANQCNPFFIAHFCDSHADEIAFRSFLFQ